MRIIGGEFRSRRIKSPPGLEARPTPDRLREALFNVLEPHIAGAAFVDAYAGCGAVGLEALSRGAREVVFIERNRGCVGVIRDNLKQLDLESRARVIHGGVRTYLGSQPADIYFLDPPYTQPDEYQTLNLIEPPPAAIVIAQHATRQALPDQYRCVRRYRTLRQGDNTLSFYRHSRAA